MTATSSERISTGPGGHPILRFAASLDAALDRVGTVDPVFMTPDQKGQALAALHRAEQRLTGLRLRVMALAEDLAEDAGARDAAAWLAHTTRTEHGPAAADLHLAQGLDRRWHRVGDAVAAGRVSIDQARVITRALEDLPDDLDPDLLGQAEDHLVALAGTYRPRALARLGRKILEVVAPDLAEEQEGRRLEDEERRARETTSLHTRRLGDGSTRISIKVPDAVADRLATYLDAFTSPRHDLHHNTTDNTTDNTTGNSTANSTGSSTVGASSPGVFGVPGAQAAGLPGLPGVRGHDGARIPAHRRRGQAFAALLEHLDPARLPDHGGDATTVLVTIGLDQLRTDLAAAGVLTSDEGAISASETRRLACNASIIPVVLGSQGQVLDLGRSARLFTRAQRKALRLRDRHCRAEHCTVPAGWCDAHHDQPWSHGGTTDLDNARLLCSWHHHRAHDTRFRADRLPNGDIRFTRRT